MPIAIIQIIGVFIVTFVALPSILRAYQGASVPAFNFFVIAIGMAMATCGIFF